MRHSIISELVKSLVREATQERDDYYRSLAHKSFETVSKTLKKIKSEASFFKYFRLSSAGPRSIVAYIDLGDIIPLYIPDPGDSSKNINIHDGLVFAIQNNYGSAGVSGGGTPGGGFMLKQTDNPGAKNIIILFVPEQDFPLTRQMINITGPILIARVYQYFLENETSYVHEFIHYLDSRRYGKKMIQQFRDYQGAAAPPMRSQEEYANFSPELNAYYQQSAHQFWRFLTSGTKSQQRKRLDMIKSEGLRGFINSALHNLQIARLLTPENKQRMIKRYALLYDYVIKKAEFNLKQTKIKATP